MGRIYLVLKGFQAPVTNQVSSSHDMDIGFEERFPLVQCHVNYKFSTGNQVCTVFPEEIFTDFVVEIVNPVSQANNIDPICPQLSNPHRALKISRQIYEN